MSVEPITEIERPVGAFAVATGSASVILNQHKKVLATMKAQRAGLDREILRREELLEYHEELIRKGIPSDLPSIHQLRRSHFPKGGKKRSIRTDKGWANIIQYE